MKQPPYAFPLPISPHLAARHAGIRIDLSEIRAWVELHAGADLAVIETAGGAFSPLGSGITNADLALALAPDAVILVALDRLGVLHDVTAARAALRTFAPALPAPIVVLQAPASLDASTGTNAAELLSLSIVSEVWSFPRAEPDSPEAAPVADALLERLRRR